MASPTKKLKVRRKLRRLKAGRKAKNRCQRVGTTAKLLPLSKPNANEKAQQLH